MLVPLVFVVLFAVIMYKIKNTAMISINYRIILYYSCIALVSSIPIIISKKQMRWYVFPSFPFYVLAISVVFNETARALEKFISENKHIHYHIKLSSVMIFVLALLLMFLGKNYVGRYKEFYNDFSRQALHIEPREIISVYPERSCITGHWWQTCKDILRQALSRILDINISFLLLHTKRMPIYLLRINCSIPRILRNTLCLAWLISNRGQGASGGDPMTDAPLFHSPNGYVLRAMKRASVRSKYASSPSKRGRRRSRGRGGRRTNVDGPR